MKSAQLAQMVKGWFVGDFDPVVLRTSDVEVAVKNYRAGDHEACHYHKIATEITVLVSGEAEMAGGRWKGGDIVVLEPGEATDFRALTDVVSVVVKFPGAKDDKYWGKPGCSTS